MRKTPRGKQASSMAEVSNDIKIVPPVLESQVLAVDPDTGKWTNISMGPEIPVSHHTLTNLTDVDDHTQYHNNTRGDIRYYTKDTVDAALDTKASVIHNHEHHDLLNLEDDDHAQYHNNARGDARYLKLDGTSDPSDDISLNSYKIIDLESGSDPNDAVNFSQLELKASKDEFSTEGSIPVFDANGDLLDLNTASVDSTSKTVTFSYDIYGQNFNFNEGVLTDPTITDKGSSKVDITSCEVLIRSDSEWGNDEKLYRYTVSSITDLQLTNNALNFIYVDYNNGNPIYASTIDRNVINNSNHIPVARVYMESNSLLNQATYGEAARACSIRKFDRDMRLAGLSATAKESGGLNISEDTQKIKLTAGYIWFGIKRIYLGAVTQGDIGVTTNLVHHTGGAWVRTPITVYDNSQYDNGTNLATVDDEKYVVNWIFRQHDDSKIAVILGTSATYSLSDAQSSSLPSTPEFISAFYVLLGRIIVKKGDVVATEIQGVSNLTLDYPTAANHADLNGLELDDHTQYHNDTRGDVRYYTKTQLNAGQLDNRYYTETETDAFLDLKVDKLVDSTSVGNFITVDPTGNIIDSLYNENDFATYDHNHIHGNLLSLNSDDHTQYLKTNGTRALTGNQSAGNNKITNLADGVDSGDAVNKSQLDTKIDVFSGSQDGNIPSVNTDGTVNDTFINVDTTSYNALFPNDVYAQNSSYGEGLLTDPVVTDLGSSKVSVSTCEVLMRSEAWWLDFRLQHFDVPEISELQLTNNILNYIYVDYNNGSPIYKGTTDRNLINNSNYVPVCRLYIKDNVMLQYMTYGYVGKGCGVRLFDRLMRLEGLSATSKEAGGLSLSEVATRKVSIGSGYAWFGIKRIQRDAITQGAGGITSYLIYHSGGDWTFSEISTYNNTQYDNGTDLATVTDGNYVVNWIFRCLQYERLSIVLGSGDYTLSQAQAASLPSLPTFLTGFNVLVGKIIVKKGEDAATEIQEVSNLNLGYPTVSNHGDLQGLGDDDHAQYHNDTRGDIRYYTKTISDSNGGVTGAKADKVSGATNGNFASLTSVGNLADSGRKHSDYSLSGHTHTHSTLTSLDSDDHTQYLNTTRHSAITNNPHQTTLDQAYDGSGSGAGRTINTDSGPMVLNRGSSTDPSLVITPKATLPTTNLVDGAFDVKTGLLCIYDNTRSKWVSVYRNVFTFGRNGNSRNVNLDMHTVAGLNTTGYKMPFDATIVFITIQSSTVTAVKNNAWSLQKNSGTDVITGSLTNGAYSANNLNVDVSAGDFLSFRINDSTPTGQNITNPVVSVGVVYRP